MKRITVFFLCVCLLVTAGTVPAAGRSTVSVPTMNYYLQLYHNGSMKNGTGSIIGDPDFNGVIDARDALRVLYFGHGGFCHSPRLFSPQSEKEELYHEQECMKYMEHKSYEYYARWYKRDLEKVDWENDKTDILNGCIYQRYTRNAFFLCDVTNDCKVGADDALMILQYAVGKRDSFARTDYSGKGNFQYMEPFEEWYPTKYYDMRTVKGADYYDKIADIFPDIPPMAEE